jgi:hypothetical protein
VRVLSYVVSYFIVLSITIAAWSKVWFCCRSLAGIAGSNPSGGIDVCFL